MRTGQRARRASSAKRRKLGAQGAPSIPIRSISRATCAARRSSYWTSSASGTWSVDQYTPIAADGSGEPTGTTARLRTNVGR